MSKYEEYVARLLKGAGLLFEREKTFKDLKKGLFRFDFYVEKSYIIEVDGQFHFQPIRGRQALMHQQQNDRRKNQYCLAYNIPLYRIPYWELYDIKKAEDFLQEKYRVRSQWHNDKLIVPK